MNLIVICIDTLRWDYLGCYSRESAIRTPLIDAYASHATRFDAAFCGSFPTVPMRVDAYTGDVNWPRYGWKGPDADQRTLPQVLREHGYYTALVLDTWNNVSAGLHEYYDEHTLITKPPTNTVRPEDIQLPVPRENVRQGGEEYAHFLALFSHYQHETDWFGARTMLKACEWLEENHGREGFFLWVDTFEAHEPWMAPDHYTAMYSPTYQGLDYAFPNYGSIDIYEPREIARMRARYAGEVTLVDRWVGHLLRQIEYLKLFENSMVILTSDHGVAIGEHGRAGKHTVDAEDPWPLYEEVIRVPLLVWTPWSDVGGVSDALVQPADLVPTALDACGIAPDAPYGRSYLPVLRQETDQHAEHVFSSCFSWDGPGRIDYLRSLVTVTSEEWSLVVGPPPHQPELYDRSADPGQKDNCAAEHADTIEHLRNALLEFMLGRGADPEYARRFALGAV